MQQLTDFISRAERVYEKPCCCHDKSDRSNRLIDQLLMAISGAFLVAMMSATLAAYVAILINQVN